MISVYCIFKEFAAAIVDRQNVTEYDHSNTGVLQGVHGNIIFTFILFQCFYQYCQQQDTINC